MQHCDGTPSDRDLPNSTVLTDANVASAQQIYSEMIQTHFADMIGFDNVVEGGMQELLYLDDFHRNVNRTERNPIASHLAQMTTEHLPATLPEPTAIEGSRLPEKKIHQETTFCHGHVKDVDPTDPVDIPSNKIARDMNALIDEILPERLPATLEQLKTPKWVLHEDDEMVDVLPELSRNRKRMGKKTKWKPNNDHLRILDEYLNSSNPIPRRKLLTTLQHNGDVTNDQLSAWLRNRSTKTGGIHKGGSARTKYPPDKNPPSDKRQREGRLEEEVQHFGEIVDSVVAEISSVMTGIDSREMQSLCRTLRNARYVICHGVGAEGLALQAFAHSLNELGMDAFCLKDVSMPQIAEDDVFLVSAGPSFYSTISALALEAKRLGTPVIAFTAHLAADMLFAQDIIRIPSQTLTPSMPIVSKKRMTLSETVSFLPDGQESVMNLAASYDFSLKLALESVVAMLRGATNETMT